MANRRMGRFISALALGVVAFSRGAGAQASVSLLDFRVPVPSGWRTVPASSSSRLAQFVVSSADSVNKTEVVVFFFGQAQGGNVDANLARWRGQFSMPDGSPVPEKVTRDSAGPFPLTIAEYRGTYRRGIGAGSADSVRTGHALVAAIVETPRGALFVQLFGPAARVAAERETFVKFVRAIK